MQEKPNYFGVKDGNQKEHNKIAEMKSKMAKEVGLEEDSESGNTRWFT